MAFCVSNVKVLVEPRKLTMVKIFTHSGIYKYFTVVLKFNFPNQGRYNRDMFK